MCKMEQEFDELKQKVQIMECERLMEKKASIVYQFVVLGAVVVMNVLAFLRTGQFNDIFVGALVGVMVGLAPAGTAIQKTAKDSNNTQDTFNK